ncbi:MAG: bifunctional nuclease family protein [Spirochaetia bacterium]|nr:bifunctional nuclease family protein [Spirochaetia bacterium]
MIEVKILEVSITQMGFAIVLQPHGEKKVVPIFIGPLETYSISSALENQKSERPMTHDLIKTIIISLDYRVARVVINNFKNGTFFARLFLNKTTDDGDSIEVDARPSDSIALAVRFGVPIFMEEHVFEKVSVDLDLIKEKKINESMSEYIPTHENFQGEGMDNELIQTILDEFSGLDSNKDSNVTEKSSISSDEFKSKKEVLEQMLKIAVNKEKYEDAARLRDEINIICKKIEK